MGKKRRERKKKKKEKKTSEASRGVVWGGERVAASLSPCGPQSNAGLASLADIFPIWPRFFPFSPTAERGPRLISNSLQKSNFEWCIENLVFLLKYLILIGKNLLYSKALHGVKIHGFQIFWLF